MSSSTPVSPTSVSLDEDPNLWLSAHCELLEQREKKYEALNRELEMLTEIHKDMEKLIGKQQSPLNEVETHVIGSLQKIASSNLSLELAHKFQNSSLFLRTGGILVLGTTLGSGLGGFALLAGIKPLIALTIGGGFGALVSSVVAFKIE